MKLRYLRARHWYGLGLALITFLTAIISLIIWYAAHKAALRDTLNGNIVRLTEAVETLRRVKRDPIWVSLPGWVKEALLSVEDALGNVAAKAAGFRELAHIRESFDDELRTTGDE